MITTLNVNGVNDSIKRYRVTEWIQKENFCVYCLQKTHFIPRETYRLLVRGWKKVFHEIELKEIWGNNALIRQKKIDFKIKIVTKDKEGH